MFSKRVMSNLNKSIVFIVLVISLTGCYGKADYEAYKDALVKTDTIQKGKHSIVIASEQTFAPSLMDTPEYSKFEGFENIKLDLSGQFDYKQEKAIYAMYMFYNDLGTDFSYYRLSERDQYIKLPMFKDYLRLQNNKEDINSEDVTNIDEVNPMKTVLDAIGIEWRKMIQEDNVFVGEKKTIKNEDGDVKATRFSIKPTTQELTLITEKIKMVVLEHQDELARAFNKYSSSIMGNKASTSDSIEGGGIDGETLGRMIENLLDTMTISQFEETAYVDIDGYIVEETITINILYNSSDLDTSLLKSQKITIRTRNWDIEQIQKMDFPKIDEFNSKPIETFDFRIQ